MDSLAGYVSDDELTVEPLRALGWLAETVSWRDKTVDWNDFAAVVIRTTWDYQKSPDEFLKVLRTIDKSRARLENSLQIVSWNLSKLYLRELAASGIKIVPTLWDAENFDEESFQAWLRYFKTDELIIKPVVSATAEFTYRLREFAPALRQVFAARRFIVQPFMPDVVAEGEFSLFYFDGVYSHAILKTPKARDFRVQEEHGGIITAVAPEAKLLDAGRRALEFVTPVPLYARIDFVRDSADDFCVMELELIEPALYFRMDDGAPKLFAQKFDERMRRRR